MPIPDNSTVAYKLLAQFPNLESSDLASQPCNSMVELQSLIHIVDKPNIIELIIFLEAHLTEPYILQTCLGEALSSLIEDDIAKTPNFSNLLKRPIDIFLAKDDVASKAVQEVATKIDPSLYRICNFYIKLKSSPDEISIEEAKQIDLMVCNSPFLQHIHDKIFNMLVKLESEPQET